MALLVLILVVMSYRIKIQRQGDDTIVVFTGLLDEVALADLRTRLNRAVSTRLVLAVGTEVTQGCIGELRRLQVPMSADSPFLAKWLEGT